MAPRPVNPILALINDAERNNAIAASLVVPDPPEWEMSEQTGLE
jgi:hypothetical protein